MAEEEVQPEQLFDNNKQQECASNNGAVVHSAKINQRRMHCLLIFITLYPPLHFDLNQMQITAPTSCRLGQRGWFGRCYAMALVQASHHQHHGVRTICCGL